MYDGSEITQEGVLCISVAYRLGVFGFLDLAPLLGADYAGSANNALRDLMAALKWIQDNIAAFSGDPTRVTIGGESAGAKLTDILMGVPTAKPLFHQMISESGGGERVWTRAQSQSVAHGFADEWHSLTGNDPSTLLTAPADTLIKAQRQFIAACHSISLYAARLTEDSFRFIPRNRSPPAQAAGNGCSSAPIAMKARCSSARTRKETPWQRTWATCFLTISPRCTRGIAKSIRK